MKKHRVSVCLLIKDEGRYLEEWLSWHVERGIDHFYIYDNGSQIPVLQGIPKQYLEFCTIMDWSGWHQHIQIDAYRDCLGCFGAETEWLAFIDTDEFLRVIDGTPLPDFLLQDAFRGADAVAAGWITYNANGLLTRDDRPVRERFTQIVEYPNHLPKCKCIVRSDQVHMMGPHWPIVTDRPLHILDETGAPRYDPADLFPREQLVVDHYFTRSLEEWREKMARGSCDPNYSRDDSWFWALNPDILDIILKGGTKNG